MLSTTARKQTRFTDTQYVIPKSDYLLWKKIWLPKLLYDALPYFYLAAGFIAFIATLYISEWFWIMPHYILFSAACAHLGIAVYRRRRRDK
jgi:hypothetical protein